MYIFYFFLFLCVLYLIFYIRGLLDPSGSYPYRSKSPMYTFVHVRSYTTNVVSFLNQN